MAQLSLSSDSDRAGSREAAGCKGTDVKCDLSGNSQM